MATITITTSIETTPSEIWLEEARQNAESLMEQDWNRYDHMSIGTFYTYMLRYIGENYYLLKIQDENR